MANQPSRLRLAMYPRPPNDNGIGMGFRLNLKPDNIVQGVAWAQQIHSTWSLVAGQDWNQILAAAVPLWQAGIMPVCRLIWPIDKPVDFVEGVERLTAEGIPAYIQIWNEPSNGREWRKNPDIGRFGESWAANAGLVFDAGGYPGIQVLGQNEWLAAFNAVMANDRVDIWQRAWFSLHNGGVNHPPDYPYDDVNQNGSQLTQDDYDRADWPLSLADTNALRASSSQHGGADIMTDDTAVLRGLEYIQWMKQSLGFSLPLIGGEAGWSLGSEDDHRYPKLDRPTHAAWSRAMCEWFATGVLSNGTPLPDEWFSVAFWIMADCQADGWFDSMLGPLTDTINAVADIPPFIRQFAGTTPNPLPSQPRNQLTDMQIAQLVTGDHFAQPDVAIAVILAESGGDTNATNTKGNTPPSTDRGLWQINSFWHAEVTDACASDPACSTEAAFIISKGGTDLSQWSGFKAGTYVRFLPRAQAALATIQATLSPASEAFVDVRCSWVTVKQGDKYRVSQVWFYDSKPPGDPESEGNVNIYVVVRDTSGKTCQHEAVTQVWPTGSSTDYTRNGMTEHLMSGDSGFDPKQGQAGAYTMKFGDASVSGLGLPMGQRVEYLIVVEKQ